MLMELTVLSDLYGPPDNKGVQQILKRNIESKLLTNAVDIRYVEEVISKTGKVTKGVCAIKVGEESFRVKHSYEFIKDKVSTNLKSQTAIGFKYKGNRW